MREDGGSSVCVFLCVCERERATVQTHEWAVCLIFSTTAFGISFVSFALSLLHCVVVCCIVLQCAAVCFAL